MHHVVNQRLKAVEKAVERAHEAIIEGDKKASERFLAKPFEPYTSEGLSAFKDLRWKVAGLRALLSHEQLATHLVRILNQARAIDPKAVQKIVDERVILRRPTRWKNHPTLTCLQEAGGVVVGLLGIVNGFRFSDDEPRIAARYDHGHLVEFVLMEKEEEEEEEARAKTARRGQPSHHLDGMPRPLWPTCEGRGT